MIGDMDRLWTITDIAQVGVFRFMREFTCLQISPFQTTYNFIHIMHNYK